MKGRREKEKLADNKEVYAVRAHMKKKGIVREKEKNVREREICNNMWRMKIKKNGRKNNYRKPLTMLGRQIVNHVKILYS